MTVKCIALTSILAALSFVPTLQAEEFFEIERVKRDKEYLYVERNWNENTACVTVNFRVSEDLQSDKLVTRAYFFDRDKKLLFKQGEYSSWSTGNGDLIRLEPELDAGRKNEIYFGIPERFENDWHRVVVVFALKGQPDTITKVIYPDDDIETYPTPGKRP